MLNDHSLIGEIIEASTTEFLAEARELYSPPSLGSFVKVPWSGEESWLQDVARSANSMNTEADDPFQDPADRFRQMEGSFGPAYHTFMSNETVEQRSEDLQPAVYGVVYHASTGSSDYSKRLRAYWKDEQRLREEQPEISEWLLVTDFRAIVIGFSVAGHVRQFLPPKPPRLHAFVYPCTADEIALITRRMDFLRTLVNFHMLSSEEVVAACIREAALAQSHRSDFLVTAGKELAKIFRNDYDRFQAIIRRMVP